MDPTANATTGDSEATCVKVLIVARTRRGSQACVGGITTDGRSVRLIAADHETNERAGMEYAVGDVWEIEGSPPEMVVPPHVEDLIVWGRRRLGSAKDMLGAIDRYMPPKVGGVEVLFDGLAQTTASGALYITANAGIPPYSTMFWRPAAPLQRVDDGKRIRYRYPDPAGECTLVFVGFQEPIETLPAGAVLRVSLAHWWRPEEDSTCEERCYVQLSGWFGAAPPAARPVSQPQQSNASSSPPAAAVPQVMHDARRLLKSVFGYDDFRPLQADVIANTLQRRDTLAIMPTDSGKSLCFQLPALLFDGLTVVVSPLIALMQDQVDQLREMGVPAAFLNSTLDYRAYVASAARARCGDVKLLYTSPETLLRPETLVLLDACRVDCIAIDEAHCISAWGHDFRPEYRRLLPVRQRYPGAVCVAFTATATPRVQRDILDNLAMAADNTFLASFNRENLYLEVQPRIDGLAQTLAFLTDHRDQSGIIYCSTRQGVDTLAAHLAAQGWSALPYHAGLDDDTRRRNQERFARDETPVMVATIAFGMGINKSNVRFVLHYNLPQSLEQYYQEIGRAGRDGLRADCLLLFSRADLQTINRFIEEGAEAERPGRHARLQAMLRYAEVESCRRVPLLEYFGENPAESVCSMCDNCLAEQDVAPQADATEAARQFLTCVKLTGQVFGASHIIDILRGSRAKAVLRHRHDRLPLYGVGSERSTNQWRHLAEQFIRQKYAEQDMEHGGLLLTAKGRGVLDGAKVYVAAERPRPAAAERPGPEAISGATYDSALFEKLRMLRRELAQAGNVPPYVIFSDRSLIEMAISFPQSETSFLAIHGVGERKLAQFGTHFLDLIRAYAAEHNLSERSPQPARPVTPRPASAGGRSREVGQLFADGRTPLELQALYGVTRYTIVNHLFRCVVAGQKFEAERIREMSGLAEADQARVLAAMAEYGHERLRPIYDALGEAISFDELHIMRLYRMCLPAAV